MQVFKFGGGIIQSPAAFQKLAHIIQTALSGPLVVVVSAIGKTTQALEEALEQKVSGQPYTGTIQKVCAFHRDLIDALFQEGLQEAHQGLAEWKQGLAEMLEQPLDDVLPDAFYSQVVAEGELLAAQLIHSYLQEQGVPCVQLDARKYVKTRAGFGHAQVDEAATQASVQQGFTPLLSAGQVVLTQGFIGSNAAGETTTLGKEGSDFSGALLAAALKAQSLTVWKDVPGVMTADPKWFKTATKLPRVSYYTMQEMALYGAKVLHPNTMQPLAKHQIPLHVRSFRHPTQSGTAVVGEPVAISQPLYILREDQAVLQFMLYDGTCWDVERLQGVLQEFAQQNLYPHMWIMEARTLSVCLDNHLRAISTVLATFASSFHVDHHTEVGLLTVMYPAISTLPNLLPPQTALLSQRSPLMHRIAFRYDQAEGLPF